MLVCAVVSDAGKRKVTECLVGDSSASILFKARGKEAEEMTQGRSLRIQGCKVDMYHGSMRLVCQPEAEIEEITDVAPKVRMRVSVLLRTLLRSSCRACFGQLGGDDRAAFTQAVCPAQRGVACAVWPAQGGCFWAEQCSPSDQGGELDCPHSCESALALYVLSQHAQLASSRAKVPGPVRQTASMCTRRLYARAHASHAAVTLPPVKRDSGSRSTRALCHVSGSH